MEYIIPVVALSLACVLWYFVQRVTGHYDGSAEPDTALHSEHKTFGCGTCTSCDSSEASTCAPKTDR